MKARFTWLGIVAALLVTISTFFVACNKDDMNDVIVYKGQVVYINTTTPFPDLTVKVTNGKDTHCQTQTDAGGNFSLKVRVNEIDGSYYLLAGDETCVPKKVSLGGYGQAEVDLGVIEVEGPALPVVTTKPVTDISDNKATSGGNVTADGRASVTARGVCWSKSEYPTIDDEHTQNGSGLGEFKSQLTNLEAGATYYVRAYASNRIGTAYGAQLTFSTTTGLPQVTTDEVSNISATTATCGGEVAANSGYAITARGICWSDKTATPTINNDHTEEVATTGHFTSMMIGLERNTTYYVRAYAVNEKGTNYGETKMFKTLNGLPSVTTTDVGENVTETTAVSGGYVVDDGDFAILERGVCWNTLPNPTINNYRTTDGEGSGYFVSTITGIDLLSSSTTYYIRAYASNINGTSYGEQISVNSVNLDYKNLPSVEYNGYKYKVYPDIGAMTWNKAYTACQNLVYFGYEDWYLPNQDELEYIMKNVHTGWKNSDGTPFLCENIDSSADYWTTSLSPNSYDSYKEYILLRLHNYNYTNGCVPQIWNWDIPSNTKNLFRPVRKYKNH